MSVVQFKGQLFNVIFDVTPEDGLLTFKFSRKQTELQLLIEILADDLGVFASFKDDVAPVFKNWRCVITPLGELPNERTIPGEFEVGGFEARSGKFEQLPLHDAERTPRKLDELNHFKT